MYRREVDGKVAEFGTTGYTKNHLFVLYDRVTDSVWYPLHRGTLDAVSGPAKGTRIKLLAEPRKMKLSEWMKKHPDSKVLLPSPHSKTVTQLRRARKDDPAVNPPPRIRERVSHAGFRPSEFFRDRRPSVPRTSGSW